ncbi:uncharacterized protein LOC106651805 [Trichogramma pretiosum]|uniref:uncharacterized protein LOC106651805 n=1 Tax=Trichogramma pretiosum TaxID=7493 RepID=UPI0006C98F39|nr:uncharacterized protein LOC106651805 [Trichogramma pretiosum]
MERCDNDSSSSEDEVNLNALREATDDSFIKKFYEDKTKKIEITPEGIADTKNTDNYETNGLSQSCKDFIARKLMQRLDSSIRLSDDLEVDLEVKNKPSDDIGIKLLSSSSIILTEFEEETELPRLKKPIIMGSYSEKSNKKKCKEVAIESDQILSQEETKYWTNRKPGKVFNYKKQKNGLLVEISN